MASFSLFQGFSVNAGDINPPRQLEHNVNGDVASHARLKKHSASAVSASSHLQTDEKRIVSEAQQESHIDPLRPDETWSLTETNHFSYVITTAVLGSTGLGAVDQWLMEMDV